MADHFACLRDGRTVVRNQSFLRVEEALSETILGALVQGAHRFRRATKTGTWMTLQPYTVNGTELGAQECQDALFLKHGLDPPDPPHYCDSCNTNLSIRCVTTSSVTRSQTCPEKPSHLLMCAANHSSFQVAL